MASRDHVSYPEQLAVKIQPSFERIKPSSVIYQFHKHSDGKILTTRDIQNVVARTQLNGDIDGAILLLERLCQYNGWFECLMKVLQDRDVKLDHFAEEMKKKKAQLDEEWNEKYGSIEQHPDSTGSTNSEFHLSRKTPQESSERQSEVSKASTSEEKFGPKSCPVSNEGTTENVVTENMRSLNFNLTVDAGDNGQLRPINVVGDIRANGQSDPGNPEDSDEDDFEVIRSNDYADMREEPLTRSLSNPAPVSDPQEQLPSGSNPTQSLSQEKNWGTSQPLNNVDGFPVEQHQSQERRQQEKKRECRHGEEYDYTEDDVATELSQIQGWHLGITEDEVNLSEMKYKSLQIIDLEKTQPIAYGRWPLHPVVLEGKEETGSLCHG